MTNILFVSKYYIHIKNFEINEIHLFKYESTYLHDRHHDTIVTHISHTHGYCSNVLNFFKNA